MVQLPVKGQLRYNANTDNWEIYNGLNWCVKVDDPRNDRPNWERWYAWRPVRVKGHWTCFKTVYRKAKYDRPSLEYTYGTVFDVIKDS